MEARGHEPGSGQYAFAQGFRRGCGFTGLISLLLIPVALANTLG